MTTPVRVVSLASNAGLPALREQLLEHAEMALDWRPVADRGAFAAQMSQSGVQLVICQSGVEGLDIPAAIQLAKAAQPTCRVLAVASGQNAGLAVACLRAGADDYAAEEHPERLVEVALRLLSASGPVAEAGCWPLLDGSSACVARTVLDALNAHVALVDENGTIVGVNRAWKEFGDANGGKQGLFAEGANYLTVCDNAAGHNAEEAASIAAGIRSVLRGERELFEQEYPCHSPSEERWYLCRVKKLSAAGPVRVAIIHENVTRAHTMADANEAKNELLSRMSHELRTPLNAILGFGQLLQLQEMGEANRESVERILDGGRQLLELVDDVLDITRQESGQLELDVQEVCVLPMLQQCVAALQPMAGKRGIQFLWDPSTRQLRSATVQADRDRLHQVLMNLLTNAVKYNREGGTVTLGFTVAGPVAGEGAAEFTPRLEIWVQDTGRGVPQQWRGHVFRPFQSLGADAMESSGKGLGLALSYSLVVAMGGQLGYRSVTGPGSCFWLRLPLCEQTGGEVAPEPEPDSRCTVLCIEDNPSNLKLIEHLLDGHPDYRLLTASTLAAGREQASAMAPDVILLDLHLPDGRGEDMLAELQGNANTRSIPVIVLSADAIPAQVEQVLAAGARAYITKPIQLAQLMAELEKCRPGSMPAKDS